MHDSLNHIIDLAKTNTFEWFEIFTERETKGLLISDPRQALVQSSFQIGFSAKGQKENRLLEYLSTRPTLKDLVSAFNFSKVSTEGNVQLEFSPISLSDETLRQWSLLIKEFWQSIKGISQFRSTLDYRKREYQVQNLSGGQTFGEECAITLHLEWEVETRNYQQKLYWLDPEAMQRDLKQKLPFAKKAIERSQRKSKPWPVPLGKIPLFFEPEAFAPLLKDLAKIFEADCFLKGASYLQGKVEFPEHFSLKDIPLQKRFSYDMEGIPKKPFPLIENGKTRGLACNKKYASELGVAFTGHGRRSHFERQAIPFFSHLKARFSLPTLEKKSPTKQGISVEEIEIENINFLTLAIQFKVVESRIVHQGEKGEWLEKFSLSTTLPELLDAISQTSESVYTRGFLTEKQNQNFILEVECPEVILRGISLPGSVPAEHYW